MLCLLFLRVCRGVSLNVAEFKRTPLARAHGRRLQLTHVPHEKESSAARGMGERGCLSKRKTKRLARRRPLTDPQSPTSGPPSLAQEARKEGFAEGKRRAFIVALLSGPFGHGKGAPKGNLQSVLTILLQASVRPLAHQGQPSDRHGFDE
ncbi:hypothetical protein BDZ88DRAFT_429762 [Geranomyces variabilis]|nr:hypothetical protein BDZ88DRAFT_429762 [Geranomyces variabilis]